MVISAVFLPSQSPGNRNRSFCSCIAVAFPTLFHHIQCKISLPPDFYQNYKDWGKIPVSVHKLNERLNGPLLLPSSFLPPSPAFQERHNGTICNWVGTLIWQSNGAFFFPHFIPKVYGSAENIFLSDGITVPSCSGLCSPKRHHRNLCLNRESHMKQNQVVSKYKNRTQIFNCWRIKNWALLNISSGREVTNVLTDKCIFHTEARVAEPLKACKEDKWLPIHAK